MIFFSVLVKILSAGQPAVTDVYQQRQAPLTLNNRPLQISVHFLTQKRGLSRAFTVHLVIHHLLSHCYCVQIKIAHFGEFEKF